MPNWCENEVDIDGNYNDMQTFVAQFFSDTCYDRAHFLDFHRVAPLDLPENEDGTPGWDYDTAVDKWGTKWALEEHEDNYFHSFTSSVDEKTETPQYMTLNARFDTAWGPPEKIWEAMMDYIHDNKLDISISWFYKEEGVCMAGWLGCD